ncbi:MAG: hypothetical protein QOG16_1293, partial [Actinomycetota bacterium]|nr:hypothetical protein [Actinomycetota bacterium]
MKRLGSLSVAIVLCWLALPGTAFAKSFSLPTAKVVARVQPDGAVEVTESITYSFSGSFTGGYREIPLRPGETISDIHVAEEGRLYRPGASAELGSSGDVDTFGVANLGDRVRIVWHYAAEYESRTFQVGYTLHRFITSYDDVADLNLRVWGEEWTTSLDKLKAKIVLPEASPEVRVWGHPAHVEGYTELDPEGYGASLFATYVPASQWVEMRVVFPTSLLTSTTDTKVVAGDGLDRILAEERAELEAFERDRARREWFKHNLYWLIPLGLALAFLPAAFVALHVWRRYGREPEVPVVPEHIPEPPGEEAPALVGALLEPTGGRVKPDTFTATLFDLIRRRYIDAIATQTQKSTWAGLRHETLDDLSIKLADKDENTLEPFEKEVYAAMRFAIAEGGEARDGGEVRLLLSKLKDVMKGHPQEFHDHLENFKKHVNAAVTQRGWWIGRGLIPLLKAVAVAWFVAIGAFVLAAMTGDGPEPPGWAPYVWGILAAIAGINAILLTSA